MSIPLLLYNRALLVAGESLDYLNSACIFIFKDTAVYWDASASLIWNNQTSDVYYCVICTIFETN